MDLTQETSASPHLEYRTSISVAYKAIDIIPGPTSADLRVEYQNQLQLSEEGLEFTLQLYGSEVNLTKWVSCIFIRLNTYLESRKFSYIFIKLCSSKVSTSIIS